MTSFHALRKKGTWVFKTFLKIAGPIICGASIGLLTQGASYENPAARIFDTVGDADRPVFYFYCFDSSLSFCIGLIFRSGMDEGIKRHASVPDTHDGRERR